MIRMLFRVFFSRLTVFATAFVAAVGVPYLTLDSSWRNKLFSAAEQWRAEWSKPSYEAALVTPDGSAIEPLSPAGGHLSDDLSSGTPDAGVVPSAALAGAPVAGLHEILNWNITPEFVTSRWTHVSTVYDESRLDGMRVPLATGVTRQDLAGSLTYYFDHRKELQRITFDGRAGDPTRLITYLTRRFNMYRHPIPGADVYLSAWNGYPTSVLLVRRAAIVKATAPHAASEIMLELNHYGLRYGLSDRCREALIRDGVMMRR